MTVKITNLRLRTIIGINDWERTNKQDVVINVLFDFDGKRASETDDINDTVNYKAITKKIIALVESSEFYLLEKLSDSILQIVMEDNKVLKATVEVDKPYALRFSDSVSVKTSTERA